MSVENIEVVGHRVLLTPDFEDAEITEGALKGFKKVASEEEWKRQLGGTQVGTIVSIGENAWVDFNGLNEDGGRGISKPWAAVGDKVYYAKYAGKLVEVGDESFIIINDEDIQCIIRDEDA